MEDGLREIALICAPSGTRLSKIAKKLTDPEHPSALQDLEAIICELYIGDPSHREMELQADELPTMWNVVRRPRGELHGNWEKAFQKALNACIDDSESKVRALCMHLSWYQPSTSELFSPVSISFMKQATQKANCRISHVIILIDDIYDMYSRLQGKRDTYRPEAIAKRAQRLHALRYSSDPTDKSTERSRIEAVESALTHLISWRQHEILRAESLAQELRAKFTVFGIKHSTSAMQNLLQSTATSRVYLSHRISEVRRQNKNSNKLPDELGDWSAVVEEVNSLHFEFAAKKQVLINPTAIDELRFGGPDNSQKLLPYLAKRWSIPEAPEYLSDHKDLLLTSTMEETGELIAKQADADLDHEHTKLLSGSLTHPDEAASSVARALASRIYFDVAFRDHVIVEHTPGLCVYRPFFRTREGNSEDNGSDWSGGVKPEILHWYRKATVESGTKRRIAFVHTRQEIRSKLVTLTSNGGAEFSQTMLSHLPNLLNSEGIEGEVADELYKEIIHARTLNEDGSHLEQDPLTRSAQIPQALLNSDGVTQIRRALDTAYQLAMYNTFTMLDRHDGVYFLLGHESGNGGGVLDDFEYVASKLCQFFGGNLAPEVRRDHETQFWRTNDSELRKVTGTEPFAYCCMLLRLPYKRLAQRVARRSTL